MSLGSKNVQQYFDKIPKEWDSLYSHENKLMYYINKYFRKGLSERYRFTFENCGDIAGKRVLDIGCGTGRFSIEFAKRGAARVVGIDFATAMIDFSQQQAINLGVGDKCQFIRGDFLTHAFNESFDIVVALGVFDYINNPEAIFNKIAELTQNCFIASFPKDSFFWGTQRKIRYRLMKKCPIYFYTYDQLVQLNRQANFTSYQIISSDRGFLNICFK